MTPPSPDPTIPAVQTPTSAPDDASSGERAGLVPRRGRVWRNFGRNQSCIPAVWEQPTSEAALVDIVRRAARSGRTVKAVGSGHSYSAIACTDGHLLDLSGYRSVLAADAETGVVTVQSGIPLWQLNDELAARGLAMPVLGDINYQSIAGGIATGTHGPGVRFGCLSTAVTGLRVVDGHGEVHDCSPEQDPALWSAGRVGLGALGLVSAVTLQTVPAFNLRTTEQAMSMREVLARLDELIDGHDHLGMFWFPGSDIALTKVSDRTDEPATPRSRRAAWINDVLIDNHLFGVACRVGRRWPTAARFTARAAATKERHSWVDRGDRVFATPRLVPVVEMEYSIPRDAFREAFTRLGRLVDDLGTPITVPVEIRWSAGDDIPLSHAYGRDSAYIAVHVSRGEPYDQYFQGVEQIMMSLEGRPHWGKLHFQSAETLAPRFPRWEDFQAVRRRMDPDGRFHNPYLDRVLGPVEAAS